MNQTTHVVGVDPGLVHTGCVSLRILPLNHHITVVHEAVPGLNAAKVADFVRTSHVPARIFVEGYRARSNLGTDKEMTIGVRDIARATGGEILMNYGVTKVVKKPLLEVLDLWKWPTATHHQDLRSAARIAILGMLKDEGMNQLIADIIRDHLAGRTWRVVHT